MIEKYVRIDIKKITLIPRKRVRDRSYEVVGHLIRSSARSRFSHFALRMKRIRFDPSKRND